MLEFSSSGSFKNTEGFLKTLRRQNLVSILEKYGREGVDALSSATPLETGETAAMWGYEVTQARGTFSITWTNSNMAGKTPLVILLQHGHGTGTGGYVAGRDFINPAMKPIFDRIDREVWKAVTSA